MQRPLSLLAYTMDKVFGRTFSPEETMVFVQKFYI